MDLKQISDNISECCDKLGKVELLGVPLESADPRFFQINDLELDEHIVMQPAAIAFFGTLKKQAARRCKEKEQDFDLFLKKKYTETKERMAKEGKKTTKADIESQVLIDNERKVQAWKRDIREAQEVADNCESFYDAWKQKGFSLREHADIAIDELRTTGSISEKERGPYIPPRRGAKKGSENNIRAIQRGKKDSE